ncbi:hypothetical protein QQM79_09280 [Marinobacteraceae bacterium S3BR75-40.1]
MSLTLIAVKLAVTLLTVLALAALAERVSARVAGVLAGFPLGTGIALFFLGWEQGPTYAAQAAVATLPGFLAAQGLALTYSRLSAHGAAISTLLAVAVFLVLAWPLQAWGLTLWPALAVTVAGTLVFHRLLRGGRDVAVRAGRNRWRIHLLRGLFSALVIIAVTSVGHISPPALAGVLAAFPITFFPLLVLLHAQYGAGTAQTLTRHYPAGLGALIAHTTVVALSYEVLGLGIGTLLGLLAAMVWSGLWLGLRRSHP